MTENLEKFKQFLITNTKDYFGYNEDENPSDEDINRSIENILESNRMHPFIPELSAWSSTLRYSQLSGLKWNDIPQKFLEKEFSGLFLVYDSGDSILEGWSGEDEFKRVYQVIGSNPFFIEFTYYANSYGFVQNSYLEYSSEMDYFSLLKEVFPVEKTIIVYE